MTPTLLIAEDEKEYQELYKLYLNGKDLQLCFAETSAEAHDVFLKKNPQLVLLDLRLKNQTEDDSFALMQKILQIDPTVKVIILTGHGSAQSAERALTLGAFEFLEKNENLEQYLALRIQNAMNAWLLENEIKNLKNTSAPTDGEILGSSPALRDIAAKTAPVAASLSNVLLLGPSGTGKTMLARQLHNMSPRATGPFITVNCHMPTELVEAELFGFKRGAFTDAREDRSGKFKLAHGGTLFLDEIGLMPPAVQAKLLTVLDSDGTTRRFTPLGADKPETADVRLICATNNDLEQAVSAKNFREDLFYRLTTITLTLPPLKNRGDDVVILADHFLKQSLRRQQKAFPKEISSEALSLLKAHAWPGNIRELKNVIERAVVFARSSYILPMDIEDSLDTQSTSPSPVLPATPDPELARNNHKLKNQIRFLQEQLKELTETTSALQNKSQEEPTAHSSLKDVENAAKRRHLEHCLASTGSDLEEACRILNISRRHLNRLVKEYGPYTLNPSINSSAK